MSSDATPRLYGKVTVVTADHVPSPENPSSAHMVDKPEVGEMSPEVVAIVTDIDNVLVEPDDDKPTLASYTRASLADWLRANASQPSVEALAEAVRAEAESADIETVINYTYNWIRDKRQSLELETALGVFWRDAYASADLDNTLAPDAVSALTYWSEDRRALFVFTERPRVAQQALVANSDYGDLADLFAGFFDTRMGPLDETATYNTIAAALGEIPASVLFVSAVGDRLDAAAAAGWQTCWLTRDDGDAAKAHENGNHPTVESFAEIELV